MIYVYIYGHNQSNVHRMTVCSKNVEIRHDFAGYFGFAGGSC